MASEGYTLADAVAQAEEEADAALRNEDYVAAVAYELRALRLTVSPLVFLAPRPE